MMSKSSTMTIGIGVTPKTCPGCARNFIPNRCQDHCGNGCCSALRCAQARVRAGESDKRCLVCYRPRSDFERFAPCDSGCRRYYFGSSRGREARTFLCDVHQPTEAAGKPRVHVSYCSVRCYNDLNRGHLARVRTASRRHARGRRSKFGNEHTAAKARRSAGRTTELQIEQDDT